MEWIEIAHPDVQGTARVTDRAFERVYRERGWARVEVTESTFNSAVPESTPDEGDNQWPE